FLFPYHKLGACTFFFLVKIVEFPIFNNLLFIAEFPEKVIYLLFIILFVFTKPSRNLRINSPIIR
ncbi:hypothetical protein NIES2130_35865, partial [Scytonema sp. HK-05]